jgi:hypothetical protein
VRTARRDGAGVQQADLEVGGDRLEEGGGHGEPR